MKVAYIAGPYRADTENGVVRNIRAAENVSIKYWQQGYAVICPHKNTALFGGLAEDAVWLEGDLEILRRCDTIIMMPSWKSSAGATAEYKLAKDLGLEIIFEIADDRAKQIEDLQAERDLYLSVLKEIANDECGLQFWNDGKTCWELCPDDQGEWCWCCIARKALEGKDND